MVGHKLRVTLVLTIILFIGLLASEVALRLLWHPPFLNPQYKRNDAMWLKNNVRLNKFGYRDRDFEIKRDPQAFRIYSLGTSYTFGWYINNPVNSYPKQLETILRKKFPDSKIEVVNASRPGFSLSDKIERFKTQGFLFTPDIVTVDLSIDDLMGGVKGPSLIGNQFIKDLKLYQFTFGNFERANYQKRKEQEILSGMSENSAQIQRLEDLLIQLKEAVGKYGSKLVIIAIPEFDPDNPNGEYKYKRFNQIAKEISEKNSITLIDSFDPFSVYLNKQDLVLNPNDPHPSALAHKMIGQYIAETLDFDKILSKPRVQLQTKSIKVAYGQNITDLKDVYNILSSEWVYFNKSFGTGSMSLILPDNKDKNVFYVEDVLKTVAAYTHEGWVGGKIDYNVYPQNNSLTIPRKLYGFPVVGISQLTAYWDENGSRLSENLDLNQLKIIQNDNIITISILKPNNFNLVKVVVDIAVNQFDLDKTTIINMFSTKINRSKIRVNQPEVELPIEGKIGPLPQFRGSVSSTGYVWVNNELKPANFTKLQNKISVKLESSLTEDGELELPIAQELVESEDLPNIEYIF